MWPQIRKFAPFAVIAGFAAVYMNKGFNQLIVDVENFATDPIGKIQARYQYLIAAGVVFIILMATRKIKSMPAPLRAMLDIGLMFAAGYAVAKFIDPPGAGGAPVRTGNAQFNVRQFGVR